MKERHILGQGSVFFSGTGKILHSVGIAKESKPLPLKASAKLMYRLLTYGAPRVRIVLEILK